MNWLHLLTVFLRFLVTFSEARHSLRWQPVTNNTDTSLRILFQNNLNATDDANHTPFIVTGAVSSLEASSACASLNENEISLSQVQGDPYDFERSFAYLYYTNSAENRFFVKEGILTIQNEDGDYSINQIERAPGQLPALCTNDQGGSTPTGQNEVSVVSNTNTFTGWRSQKAFVFEGIPYANPVQRWEYSTVYSAQDQYLNVTAYGPQCAQNPSGSEQCLILNIFTPYLPTGREKTNLKPVMFWIHGGGFTGGNGQTDGSNMASREDVVFVSIQYRLSTLGFLAVPGTNITGNYGIGDQITALRWVQENIAAFGGDPTKVTIVGESAGAGSVRVLLGSPPAIGNYRGGIAMSNLGGGVSLGLQSDYSTTYSSYLTISQSYALSEALFSEAGCNQTTVEAQITCLRGLPALTIQDLSTVARYVVQDGTIVDTEQLIVNVYNDSTAHVPVLFSVMADDGASFISYPATTPSSEEAGLEELLYASGYYAQDIISSGLFPLPSTGNFSLDVFNVSARVMSDVGFKCIDEATVFAGTVSGAFPAAWYAQFDRAVDGYDPDNVGKPPASPGFPRGNPALPYFRVHAGDLEFAFGNVPPTSIREPEDLWFAQLASGYWAEFSKSLQPNPPMDYLRARGYVNTLEATQMAGPWNAVGRGSSDGPMNMLDWPPQITPYNELAQCTFLNYSLTYYLDSDRG